MNRIVTETEVIYSSTTFSELHLAKIILNFLSIDMSGGVSNMGKTFRLSLEDAIRFEKECKEWRDASQLLTVHM